MKAPRLASAAAAVFLIVAALAVAAAHAHRVSARHIHAIAPQMFAQKNQGTALQRAAFRQPDLLPIYGSSDLNVRNRYHASALFRNYPTGFTVFPVGNAGSTSLIWLQALAAVGSDLLGKKVAVSLSPRPFMSEMADRHAYAANFSRLHANGLAFSTRLSFAVKRDAARRMLAYPATLANDPLLAFALARLADDSWSSRALYYASVPLGTLHSLLLRLQDDWETVVFLRAQLGWGPVARHRVDLDWTALVARAEQEARGRADGNSFGFESEFWADHAPEIALQKGRYPAEVARRNLEQSAEWADLALLLRVLRDLGAEPLLLSIPMKGAYYDYLGIPASIRTVYYERLRELAEAYAVPLIDFADHDEDRYFTVDPNLHLSDAGWVHYNRALDAFFHSREPGNL